GGPYPITVTARWTVRWSDSTGESGTFASPPWPVPAQTGTTTVTVREIQAINEMAPDRAQTMTARRFAAGPASPGRGGGHEAGGRRHVAAGGAPPGGHGAGRAAGGGRRAPAPGRARAQAGSRRPCVIADRRRRPRCRVPGPAERPPGGRHRDHPAARRGG